MGCNRLKSSNARLPGASYVITGGAWYRRRAPGALCFLVCSLFLGGGWAVGSENTTQYRTGDCVLMREGGHGRVLVAPTYWVRGTVVEVIQRRHRAGICTHFAKQAERLTLADWRQIVEESPCVMQGEDVRDVDVERVTFAVEAWETPWSRSHGQSGRLFRGYYLDQELVKGGRLEIDALWLQPCVPIVSSS